MNWAFFFDYVSKTHSPDYAKDLWRYARQYYYCLVEADLSPLIGLSECKRNYVLCALSNLSRFLGCYEEFHALVRRFGLKWKSVSPDILMLRRIVRERENGLLEWIRMVKERVPSLSLFLDFCLLTGLRGKEAIASWNLIRELAAESRLEKYYNKENKCLEHFRFRELFIRPHKRAFISFIHEDFVHKIGGADRVSWPLIHNRIAKKGLPLRFGDMREYWANYMLKWLNPAEIDFLQGRIGASVFMKNYFNPALIGDLRDRVLQAQKALIEQISRLEPAKPSPQLV
ncbi:MAG: hypothetical protein QXR45_01210 [Candidatus Bathyarchaeia archaeon]